MKTILIFSISLLLTFSVVKAQDISSAKLTWSASQMENLRAHKTISYPCTFETSQAKSILWNHKGGPTLFTITSSVGTWTNIAQSGKVVYTISFDALTGTLTFERNSSTVSVTLDLSQQDGSRVQQKYSITNVSASN